MNKYTNIYKNNIKDINNNKEYCYLNNINNIKINNLFKDLSQIYKYKFSIKTPLREYKTHLIGKTDEYLVTQNEEKIYLNDILYLEVID